MPTVGAHRLGRAGQSNTSGAQHWSRIILAKGSKFFEIVHHVHRQVADHRFGVDVEVRDQLVNADLRDHLLAKVLPKRIDILGFNRQTSGGFVTTELDQMLLTTRKRLIQIDTARGPAGPNTGAISQRISGNHDRRAMVELSNAARSNSNDSQMPIRIGEDQCGFVLRLMIVFDDFLGRLEDFPIQGIAVFIELIDVLGKRLSSLLRFTGQQFDSKLRLTKSSRSVEPRAQGKPDVFGA